MKKQGLCLVLLAGLLSVPLGWGQDAGDITVPSGFRVEKILEANRIPDPQNIAFLPNGDMLVGSMFWRIARLTPTGDVSTFVKFKTLEGPNPFDLVVTPSGTIFFTHSSDQVTNPGLYRLDGGNPVLVTPPGWMLTYLAMDEAGTFYATASKAGIPACVVKITDPDGDGQYDVTPFLTLPGRNGLFYRAGYLYVVTTGGGPDGKGTIRRFNAATGAWDGQYLAPSLSSPRDLAMDSAGYFYTLEYVEDRMDGLGLNSYSNVVKFFPGNIKEIVATDIRNGGFVSVAPDDTLYISEFYRGVVSKVVGGVRSDVNLDYGFDSISDIAFDLDNRPYFSQFRYSQLKRLDPETGSTENVTVPLGTTNQTLAVDTEGRIYLSNSGPNAVYRFDPADGSLTKLADFWTRTLRFDSFGRLIVTHSTSQAGTNYDDFISTVGIMDLATGTITPYITGIRNIERGFLFDADQNFFVKMKRGDGIIKVNVPETPTTPSFSVEGQPLFYDLRSKDSEIRFFARNVKEQLLIPLSDAGEIVLGETDGSWSDFASGFNWPGFISFDRNGIMYATDYGNGVFRIIGEAFVVPTITERLRGLCSDIRAKVANAGVANSLCQKIEGAIDSLMKGHIGPGINKLEALINEIQAQSGLKITVEDAAIWMKLVRQFIAGLNLL